MKKLFTFFAAMLITLSASAKVVNITPTSPRSTDNIRYALRDSLTADTIRLAAGTYTEANSISADRNIVIIAAEGASPVVQLGTSAYIQVSNAAKVTIKGLKFDGFVNDVAAVQYAIRPYDASASEIRVENCEFYGFLKNIITSGEGNHADSLIVHNCYFHNNNGRAAVYFPASTVENQQTISGVKVLNSTFANNNAANDYVGMIDVRSYGLTATDDIEVIVDHCTFYNNTTKNTDYADVNTREINRSTVSNCIFAHPEEYDRRATFMYNGSVVTNCITHNLTKDGSQFGHTWMSTRTNCSNADPVFTNAAAGDFSLKGNWVTMELSPARGAATDGSDLGDPRWYTAETLPEVDFAEAYQLIGTKAVLVGEVQLNANNNIEYYDTQAKGTATWKIQATKACELGVTLNMEEGSNSGHKFKVEVLGANNAIVGELAEAAQSDADGNIELTGSIVLPAAGSYTIKLSNLTPWSSAKIAGVTFTEIVPVEPRRFYLKLSDAWAGYPAKYAIYYFKHGVGDGWSDWMTAVENETNLYTATIPADNDTLIFVRLNGNATEINWGNKWSQTVDLAFPEDDKDMFTVTAGGTENNCTGEWSKYVAELPAKFYITGDVEALGQWNPAAIKATEDAHVLHLAAGAYKMKVTVDGTWSTGKGIENLTERAAGLQDINGNIGFILAEAGDVTVTYNATTFKLEGDFVNTPIYKTYFATGEGWTGDDASNAVYDAENEKIVVTLVNSKQAQWQAQVWYKTTVAKADKLYDISLKIKANKAINGVIAKWQNEQMIFSEDIALEAGVAYELVKEDQVGKDGGDGMLIFDFGFAPAETNIEIYDIVITEKDAPEIPDLADGFYLIGLEGWDIYALKAEYKLDPNPGTPEFMISVTLEEGDEIQVVNVLNKGITAWFPGGVGNNYVVDAAHAGEKTVYFRPDNQGGEGWHHGCIYIEANTATAIDNAVVEGKAVKVIRDGQMLIIRDGKTFNAMGTEL